MNTIALRSAAREVQIGDLIARRRKDEEHFGPVVRVEPADLGRSYVFNAACECRVFSPISDSVIRPTEVEVGSPATIHLYTDSVAAVVVKVTKTQVHVRRVETGEAVTVEQRGPWPVVEAEGILDRPTGPVEVYRVGKDGVLAGGGDRSIRLSLGRSISRTDYSY